MCTSQTCERQLLAIKSFNVRGSRRSLLRPEPSHFDEFIRYSLSLRGWELRRTLKLLDFPAEGLCRRWTAAARELVFCAFCFRPLCKTRSSLKNQLPIFLWYDAKCIEIGKISAGQAHSHEDDTLLSNNRETQTARRSHKFHEHKKIRGGRHRQIQKDTQISV
jgi:hypothetical protein